MQWLKLTIICLLWASLAQSHDGVKEARALLEDHDVEEPTAMVHLAASSAIRVRLPRYPPLYDDDNWSYDYSVVSPTRLRFPEDHGYDPVGLHIPGSGYNNYGKQLYKRPYDVNYGLPNLDEGYFQYPEFAHPGLASSEFAPSHGPSFSDYYDRPLTKPVNKRPYQEHQSSQGSSQHNTLNDDGLHRGITGNRYGHNPHDRIRPGLEPAGVKAVTPELLAFLRRTLKSKSTPLRNEEGTDGRNRYPGIAG